MRYVFIHGLGQNSESWDKTISFMPDVLDIECPDLFALMDGKENNYSNMYQVFAGYCNELSEPLHLCGLSLGGVLALHYAIENPKKMQSLVLVGTQYKMPKTLLKIQNIIFRFIPESVFKRKGISKKEFIDTFVGLTNSMMGLDFSNTLKNVSCNTLIICGSRDGANKKASVKLASCIPKATSRIIENSGHAINEENPEALADVLLEFYK